MLRTVAVAICVTLGGCHCGRVVEAAPVSLYTNCRGDPGPQERDRCLYFTAVSGTTTLISQWVVCGQSICRDCERVADGPGCRPHATKCVPIMDAGVTVTVCVPGYQPMKQAIDLRPASPFQPSDAVCNIANRTGSPPLVANNGTALIYELVPAPNGGGSCPLLPADAGTAVAWQSDCSCL